MSHSPQRSDWTAPPRKPIETKRPPDSQTEQILAAIPSILIGVSSEGRIAHWNSVAESTFGISTARVLGQPLSECVIQWDTARILAGLDECQNKGCLVRIESVEFIHPNGNKKLLGFAVIPIRQQKGAPVEYLLFGADVTQKKQAEELKHDFVSTVSHELRTPLTIIKEGVAQVLEGLLGQINPEQKRFLNISLEGIERLGRIVDDLLDISKIDEGRLKLKREAVDLATLAKGMALAFDFQAHQKGLEIRTHLPPFPVEAFVDHDKIAQVFTNLISNALKFTEAGRIEIAVGDQGERALCCVSDTGRGIVQEDLPKVFGKFQQFSRGRAVPSVPKGTGLGLAICKGIVDLHGGRIWVESELDKGSAFFFELPKVEAGETVKETA